MAHLPLWEKKHGPHLIIIILIQQDLRWPYPRLVKNSCVQDYCCVFYCFIKKMWEKVKNSINCITFLLVTFCHKIANIYCNNCSFASNILRHWVYSIFAQTSFSVTSARDNTSSPVMEVDSTVFSAGQHLTSPLSTRAPLLYVYCQYYAQLENLCDQIMHGNGGCFATKCKLLGLMDALL